MLFEKFVGALDEHDPFIAALLDVLVKVCLHIGQSGRRARRHSSHLTPILAFFRSHRKSPVVESEKGVATVLQRLCVAIICA